MARSRYRFAEADQAHFLTAADRSSPQNHCVRVPARQAYSHSASVGSR